MLEKIKESFNFIIFGASGDLANLKLFPSLYELALQKRFPAEYSIIGYARSDIKEEDFKKSFAESAKEHTDPKTFDQSILDDLLTHVSYFQGQYDKPEDYEKLAEELDDKQRTLAFFSVPPVAYESIIENMGKIKKDLGGNVELMIEKPFGNDRESAGDLFQFISNYFATDELYLIDHYLGKAAVKSIFPLRYNNTILNLLLKGKAISNIQISALETTGVEERIGFFDQVGIIKDMVQSHLLQVLALLTMSMPVKRDVRSIRREKGDIISALRYPKDECGVVIGQYNSYKDQLGIKKDSKTPTFVALRCFIDLTDWYEVPIYIRAGKKLSHKHTYIVIEFKKPPYTEGSEIDANRLIIELYPHEKIQMRLVNDLGKQVPKFSNLITEDSLACMGDECLPPYAGLILDAFLKRDESFLSIDEILSSWHFVDSIADCVKDQGIHLAEYEDGSDGPQQQYDLTNMDNMKWYDADSL